MVTFEPQAQPVSRVDAPVTDLTVSVAAPADAIPWDAFVAAHRDSTVYHRWAWRAVIERGLGHQAHYLIARAADDVRGVLPIAEVRSVLFGRVASSLPYVNYGGILAADERAADALLKRALELTTRRKLSHVLLRHRRRHFPALAARTHKVTMLLPLAPDEDAMWKALDRKVRNQIRKAEKSSVRIVAGGLDLLPDFYRVFSENMRDLGTPVYSMRLFAEILRALPDAARIYLARVEERTIAGALTIDHGPTVEVPSASSLRDFRSLCPNHLLYWEMIRDAIRRGCTVFDFGRSTPNDGTYHFKEQWGGKPEPLYWEHAYPDGRTPALPGESEPARFSASVAVWKRLPLTVTRTLGPRIVRLVP